MLDIYFKKGFLLVKGREFSARFHRHYPHQIVLSPRQEVPAVVRGGEPVTGLFLLIRSNVSHYCRVDCDILSLFVDPETREGQLLTRLLGDQDVRILSPELLSGVLPGVCRFFGEDEAFEEGAAELSREILKALIGDCPGPAVDPRIAEAVRRIETLPDKKISVDRLANRAGLSRSRLMHLFRESLGIPVRRYLLWKRLQDGLILVRQGLPLTRAAIDAGFADYAHFSRTFKSTFGVSLKSIFKNSTFVHVFFDQDP